MKFPHYHQLDAMDCGPTCLRMVAKHYGKHYSLETLRQKSFIGREGVSMLGISTAAESIGFRSIGVHISFQQLAEAPMPCIVHWKQNHFVVVYDIKIRKNRERPIVETRTWHVSTNTPRRNRLCGRPRARSHQVHRAGVPVGVAQHQDGREGRGGGSAVGAHPGFYNYLNLNYIFMMKKNLFVFVLLMSVLTGFAQTVTLTFTGRDANNNYCQLDKVVIVNQTQGWQETIYWPDTTLAMEVGTGIEDFANEGAFAFSQNNPNPFAGTTEAMLNVVETGDVILELTDVNGRIIETKNFASLHPGNHQFQINVAAAGIYFLTARQNGHTSSIKMVNTGNGAMNKIEYQNFVDARNNNNNVETWR